MKYLRRIWLRLWPQYRRIEFRRTTYAQADQLIRESQHYTEFQRWVVAREEDTNTTFGIVCIERRERITQ